MTNERFESRVLDNGTTEYVFGISWQHTSEESLLSNNERKEEERQPVRRGETNIFEPQRPRFAVQADNQTKLELEDKAAEGLQKRLKKEKLCPNGHQIDEVMWRDDNIKLLGHCL